MRTRVKGTARAALVTASLAAVGIGTFFPIGAYADTTSGDFSVLGGNQVNVPVSVPVNVCGNAVAVLGVAGAGCEGGAKVKQNDGGGKFTSGHHSVLGGNQIDVPIKAPVNVCGNAVAVLGVAGAGCEGGAKVKEDGGNGYGGKLTSGDHSVLGGNQAGAPVSLPVNICGNAVGNAFAGCEGGATAKSGGSLAGDITSGRHSIGGGNQVAVPIKAPINVCGNAVAVLGDASAGCAGGSSVGGHDGHNGYGGHKGHDCSPEPKGGAGYRTHQAASLPVNPGSLPVDPSAVFGSLPVDPTGLPGSIPGSLPVDPSAVVGSLPVDPTGLPGSLPVPAGARSASASPVSGLPVAPPVSLPVTPPAGLPGSLPVDPSALVGSLPVDPTSLTGSLPVAPPELPADLPTAPKLGGTLPVAPKLPGALPVKPQLPALPGGLGQAALARSAGSEVAPIPPRNMPGLPVGSAPRIDGVVGQVAGQVGTVKDTVTGAVPDEATEITPMAKSQLLTSGVNPGSAYVLIVSALLATAAAAMAFTRRIRFGHR
ncbi:MAG: chaplin family protein [Actinomadura sp.]